MTRKLLIFAIFIVLLTGCASNEGEEFPDYQNEPPYELSTSLLQLSSDTLTYTDLFFHDILSGLGKPSTDYSLYLNNTLLQMESEIVHTSYKATIQVLEEIDAESLEFDITALENYSSSDIYAYSLDLNIDITADTIITFNDLKNEQIEIDAELSLITREYYIETRLGRELLDNEVVALDLLQRQYYELHNHTSINDYIFNRTLSEILQDFSAYLGYIPDATELDSLQKAYDIILEIHHTTIQTDE